MHDFLEPLKSQTQSATAATRVEITESSDALSKNKSWFCFAPLIPDKSTTER